MGNSSSNFNYETHLAGDKGVQQSIQVSPAETGFGPVLRHRLLKGAPDEGYQLDDEERRYTLWDAMLTGAKLSGGDAPFLGSRKYRVDENPVQKTAEQLASMPRNYKPTGYVERGDGTIMRYEFVWDSYQEVQNTAAAIGRGLIALGHKKHDNMALFAVNRAEWTMSSLGFYSQNMRTISLYATLGPDAVEYIVNHAETPVVIVSKENLNALMKVLPKIKDTVKQIVMIDAIHDGKYGNTLDVVTEANKTGCAEHGITLMGLSDLIALGNQEEHVNTALNLPGKDDLAFIMYTSGTTGVPKGVMLSHCNILSAVGAIKYTVKRDMHTYFSYLPLAHIFETVAQAFIWTCGGKVGFSQGDIRRLVDDLTTLQPTFLPGVPRVFLKFYQNVWAQVEKRSCIARWYIHRAYATQCDRLRNNQPLDETADAKVFSLMREKMGLNNIKIMITGAAPCPSYLVEFMRVVSNAFFSQGYGMTESSAASMVSEEFDKTVGSVGGPLASNDVRLCDIPDMNYLHSNPVSTGEILLSGPNVFLGYFKNEEATNEAISIDKDGRRWLHTGDVGRVNPNGTISIIDRKKQLLKIQQGEYISLENLEDNYSKSPLISQFCAYGNSYKSFMVGIAVPNTNCLYDLAVAKGWWNKSLSAPVPGSLNEQHIAEFTAITKKHYNDIKEWLRVSLKQQEGNLQGFEKIKDFIVDCNFDELGLVFTEANNCLTPTMKKKRKNINDKYMESLKELYTVNGEKPENGENW